MTEGLETGGPALTKAEIRRLWWFSWSTAAILSWSLYFLQWRIGVNLADEGYLWYGVWRSLLGEIPRVDFRSYDPVRVWWVVAWCRAFGFGPAGIRAGLVVFQTIGLSCGILALSRISTKLKWLAPTAVVLVAWMQGWHKLFEPATALMAVLAGVLVIEKPSLRRVVLVGVFVGFAATIRRNHGVYTAIPLGSVVLLASGGLGSIRTMMRRGVAFGLGIVVGFSPILISAVVIPGFAAAYLGSVTAILERGVTNQALPVPWPWRADITSPGSWPVIRDLATGIGFLLLVAVPIIGLVVAARLPASKSRTRKLLLVSSLLGVTYAHHGLVRSDAGHLMQAIQPALVAALGLIAVGWKGKRWARAGGVTLGLTVVLVTIAVVAASMPIVQLRSSPQAWEEREILGEMMVVRRGHARLLDAAQTMTQSLTVGESLFLAPNMPGVYVVVHEKAPVWDPYPLWPPEGDDELAMVADLEGASVRWAIVLDQDFAGVRFAESYPRVWAWIQHDFEEVPGLALPGRYRAYRHLGYGSNAEGDDRRDVPSKTAPTAAKSNSGSRQSTATTTPAS